MISKLGEWGHNYKSRLDKTTKDLYFDFFQELLDFRIACLLDYWKVTHCLLLSLIFKISLDFDLYFFI